MSISLISHNHRSTVLLVEEDTWTARVCVDYVNKPTSDFVHHEGQSFLCTSENSFIRVSVSMETKNQQVVNRNIHTFPYHKYICAEAWTLVWGKLYAPL